MNAISIKNLSKQYKKKVKSSIWRDLLRPRYKTVNAVSDISFDIKRGESVAFLGPNGAGKTTTIKMLTGLIHPTSGQIKVLGFEPQMRKKEFLQQIGLVMGNKAGLNWDLSASQSFLLAQKIYRIADKDYHERLAELTKLLDVGDLLDTQIRRLSLGERMKMELIASLLHKPKLLLLDEPTIGLDIKSKQRIRQFLRTTQEKYGVTMLLTSHDMDDVENVSDRVIVISDGKLVVDSDIHVLFEKYNHEKYVRFYMPASFTNRTQLPEFKLSELIERKEGQVTYKVAREALPDLISQMTRKYEIVDIDIDSIPLEQIIGDIFENSQ